MECSNPDYVMKFLSRSAQRYTSGLSADEELFVVATKGGNVDVEMVGAQHITAKQR